MDEVDRDLLRPLLYRTCFFARWHVVPIEDAVATVVGFKVHHRTHEVGSRCLTLRLRSDNNTLTVRLRKPGDSMRLLTVETNKGRPRLFLETPLMALPVVRATKQVIELRFFTQRALQDALPELFVTYFAQDLFNARLDYGMRRARYTPYFATYRTPLRAMTTRTRIRMRFSIEETDLVRLDVAPVRDRYYFAVCDLQFRGGPRFRERARLALEPLCASLRDDGARLFADALPLRSLAGICEVADALADLDYLSID